MGEFNEMGTPTIIKSENVGWKGEEPTEVVKKTVDEGIIKVGDRVLDIGCGFGRNANYLAEEGAQVTAVNINDQEIAQAKARAHEAGVNIDYLHADATSLPFADASFDAALDLGCSHMIPTRELQEKAAREAARVIKPGGALVFFGFSKDHPSYQKNPAKPMFRSLEDIQAMYGEFFEIVSYEKSRWEPSPQEHANFKEHVGINIVMKRK